MGLSIDTITGRRKQKVILANSNGIATIILNDDTEYFEEVVILSTDGYINNVNVDIYSLKPRNFDIIIPSIKYASNPSAGTIITFYFKNTNMIPARNVYFNRANGNFQTKLLNSELYYRNVSDYTRQVNFHIGRTNNICSSEDMCNIVGVYIGNIDKTSQAANYPSSLLIKPYNTNNTTWSWLEGE